MILSHAILALCVTAAPTLAPRDALAPPPLAQATAAEPQPPPPPPSSSGPAQPSPEGFTAAIRAAYAIPMGDVATGSSLSDNFNGAVPFWVDLGYRFGGSIFVGGYFQYAFAPLNRDNFVKTLNTAAGSDVCGAAGVTCDVSGGYSIRFGLEAIYRFTVASPFVPWVGVGTGWEIAHGNAEVKTPAGGLTESDTFSGWEYFNLQAGGDFRVGPGFSIGPFVAFSLGKYTTASYDLTSTISSIPTQSQAGSITNTATHSWLQLGLKGTLDF